MYKNVQTTRLTLDKPLPLTNTSQLVFHASKKLLKKQQQYQLEDPKHYLPNEAGNELVTAIFSLSR